MTENPLVSVVIPAYRAEKYLTGCLKAIKEQSYKNFEIIVVDDFSPDRTLDIAKEAGAKVARNEKNLGEGASRNVGAKLAKGEIIAHTDSDVVVPRTWLEKIVKDMKEFGVGCVGGGYSGSIGDSFIQRFSHFELAYRRQHLPKFVKTLVANNFASTRDIFFEAGGFPEKYKCEDMILSYKISQKHQIYWDKDNGVLHNFRDSLKAYFRQQYFFARDTVLTYYRQPKLLKLKTHQGKQVYIEAILTFLLYLTLIFVWQYFLIPIVLIFLINIPFLTYLQKNKLNWLESFLIIFWRNVVCTWGVMVGAWYIVLDILKFKDIKKYS